jgi:ligand-binding sensor domain-containing protein
MLINPTRAGEIFVGTDVGVFYSKNGGANWTSLMNGLPTVAVLGLTYDQSTQTLWASTHGRGVWQLSISSLR